MNTNLALSLGVTAQQLRSGRAVTGRDRQALAGLLLDAACALVGRPVHGSSKDDPQGLIMAAVAAARDAGMSAPDIVEAVNDALERSVRPVAISGRA